MKDTGIVRRIDELGRIVIPKEIRRTLRLGVGAQMEIYTTAQNELVLKKYSAINEIKDFAENFCSALSQSTQKKVLITDTDQIIACSYLSKKDYLNKSLHKDLEKLINERKSYILNVSENANTYSIVENDKTTYTSQIIVPIMAGGDVVGSIIMVDSDKDAEFSTTDVKVVQTVAMLLSSILE